ncbi:MAG: bifunctional D-glycero-beta-D-manno-heptose-7-phosphate kinase/D-glycero-beta-D-manno-heptose 1-phosphate adenylyltransferase HldE [Pseudomonadales bacterium]
MKIPRFDDADVLVVGDAMLDRYWHGDALRISAEAPVPVVDITEIEERLGAAANVALNVASLGGRATLVAARGPDESGALLASKLESAGIKSVFYEDDDIKTTTKLRIVSHQQQLVRADFEQIRALDSNKLLGLVDSVLEGSDALVLSDYDKGLLTDPQSLIRRARQSGVPVLVDPKFKDFEMYRGATIIKPNLLELEKAVGAWVSEKDMVSRCHQLIERLDIEALLLTRHSQGMTLIQRGQEEIHFPARKREVYDVSGAGDTVIAVLASALSAGETLPDSVALANLAAGLVVMQPGTASVSGPELRLEVASQAGFNKGIMSEEQLLIAVEEARGRGEKIVFTNGCFDILHAGHVDYLSEAKAQGDRLIVAVNDDHSVNRLKGAGRPINALDRRMILLAGLAAVDWVVSFAEDTPENLLRTIKPDVLAKGGDYSVDQVVGTEIVKAYNGEVKVVKLVEDCSTSALVEKIRRL